MPYIAILPSAAPTPTTTSSGVTLSAYRERLARKLGYFGRGVISAVATGLEAERYAVASGFRSDFTPPDRYDDMYLFMLTGDNAGTQRKLVNGSFDGPNGAFMVDYPFDTALDVADTFEIAVMPAKEYVGVSGLNDVLNLGAEKLGIIDDVQVTSDGTRRISMDGYPWPIKSVQAVYRPITNADDRLCPIDGWMFENDADTPYIQLVSSFTSGDIITIKLTRPATTWISVDGTWADSTVGLVAETDAALYDAETVALAALPIAYERQAQMYTRGSKERADILSDAHEAATVAGISKWFGSFRGNGVQKVGARRRTNTFWENI